MNDTELQVRPADKDESEIERAASEIARMAGELAGESDRERRLPDPVVAALSECGLLRGGAPREVDALELPPATALRCAEEIESGDASAGWCVSIRSRAACSWPTFPPRLARSCLGPGGESPLVCGHPAGRAAQ